MSRPPKVIIDDTNISRQGYIAGNKRYAVADLIAASREQKLVPFNVPLASINLSADIWTSNCFDEFLFHSRRIEDCDLQYPIIYDVYGCLCDGWHRVAKAILADHTTIQAVRLQHMPTYTVIPAEEE